MCVYAFWLYRLELNLTLLLYVLTDKKNHFGTLVLLILLVSLCAQGGTFAVQLWSTVVRILILNHTLVFCF